MVTFTKSNLENQIYAVGNMILGELSYSVPAQSATILQSNTSLMKDSVARLASRFFV